MPHCTTRSGRYIATIRPPPEGSGDRRGAAPLERGPQGGDGVGPRRSANGSRVPHLHLAVIVRPGTPRKEHRHARNHHHRSRPGRRLVAPLPPPRGASSERVSCSSASRPSAADRSLTAPARPVERPLHGAPRGPPSARRAAPRARRGGRPRRSRSAAPCPIIAHRSSWASRSSVSHHDLPRDDQSARVTNRTPTTPPAEEGHLHHARAMEPRIVAVRSRISRPESASGLARRTALAAARERPAFDRAPCAT